MMFNFKFKIPAYVFTFNKNLLFSFNNKTDTLVCYNINNFEILWQFEVKDIYSIEIFNNHLLLSGGSKVYKITENGQLVWSHIELGFNLKLYLPFNIRIICAIDRDRLPSTFGVFDLLEENVFFWGNSVLENEETTFTPFGIFDNLVLGKGINRKTEIKSYSFQGAILWHFNLNSLFESHASQMAEYDGKELQIHHIAGVHNGLLWLDVDVMYHGAIFVALDTATGRVVHLLQEIAIQNEHGEYFMRDGATNRLTYNYLRSQIDPLRNQFFGFCPDTIHWQIDLNEPTPIIKVWSLDHYKAQYKCFFSSLEHCGITHEHIYFPVGGLGINKSGVMILNRDTLEIDHILEVDAKKTGLRGVNQVKVSDTHLFLKSPEGTLGVFEKIED